MQGKVSTLARAMKKFIRCEDGNLGECNQNGMESLPDRKCAVGVRRLLD